MIRTSFVEKALVPSAPRSLGRALRQLRGAATPPAGFKPSDGDGDGKMSLGPGLPDDTPVPPKPKDIVPEVVEAVSKKPKRRSFAQEYSYERMLKNLDLDAINADLDEDLTIAELHELVGFPEPDENVRHFIIQGEADNKPKIKPTGKRKTGNRGRPAATYRTGDFIDLLKEAKQPKRPVKVKRFAKQEVTMEEINAALGDDAMDLGNLSKVLTRLGLKPIRSEAYGRGRPRRIFSSSDAYQVLTEYFDDYAYGTGPYGPRTQIVRSGRTYQKSLNDQSTKILGLGIGRRGPRGGKVRRRRNAPQDGDGDGFYSPRPGMPDKTPVPAAMATNAIVDIGEEGFSGATATEREISVAVAASKKIEAEIIKEYGEIRTRKQAMDALQKAFPNAKISLLERGAADSEISNTDRNHTIAFLHAARLKPKAAKRLTAIQPLSAAAKRKGDAGGQKLALQGNVLLDRGIEILRETSFSRYAGRQVQPLPGAPWGQTLAAAMHNSGNYSVEDIDRIYQQGIVLHEMGHLAHFDAGADDMTYEGTDTIRNEIFAEALAGAMGNTVEEVNDAAIAAAGSRFFETEQEKLSYGLNQLFIQKASYRPGNSAELDAAKRFQKKVTNKIWDRLAWDGTPEEKRASIAAELGKVSEYGATKIQEGIAETFARTELTGGSHTTADLSARKFFRWVLTKEAKMKKEAPEIELSNCSGYPTEMKIVGNLPPKDSKKPAPAKVQK